ncbi:probable G-protein coupled receptor 139 [Hemiscyllium ocellatum]|uniref:probable G-protein coupled receptor 139 n=1 Tax=Hemiscyllium ocellatum TaxID=170820 RepID=UPI0029662692|nr:probable G-protein coupled receptor 139 [Hemiscyllium ocellatum]
MRVQALPIEILFLVLAIFGIPANLMTVLILSQGKCGLSKGITHYMIAMATGDLMVLVFNVIVSQIFKYHFPGSLLNYTPACRLSAFLQGLSIQLSIWFTISFTFDRFVAICCNKLKRRYCTERMAKVVIFIVSSLNIMVNIPLSFRYEHTHVLNNVQWGCRTVTTYLTSPVWAAHRWLTNISNMFLPIPLLLLLNTLTASHILAASRVRLALKSSRGDAVEMGRDPELKSRRTSIILLFTISSCFMVLSAPITVIHICVGVTHVTSFQVSTSLYVAIRAAFLLMCTSSCTNTCIYALTQRRFRKEVKNLLKYPYARLRKL